MKRKMKKKLIAFMLCMVLVICNSVSILADTPAAATTTAENQVSETKTAKNEKSSEETKSTDDNDTSKQSEETDETKDEAPEATTTEKKEETTEATTEDKEDATTATTEAEEPTTEATTEDKATTEAVDETSENDKKKEATTTEEEKTTAAEENTETPTELTYENDDVKITVSANAENAIPEGASLQVVPILENDTETAEQYKEVVKELQDKSEKEEYAIAGFLAYDITFIDADGNEVEPNGEVKVSMEYTKVAAPVEMKDEEAFSDTNVTVMHLEEDENGQIKDVVDMSENNQLKKIDATEKKEVQTAEFVTESFSAFTITWVYVNNRSDNDGTLKIYPHYGCFYEGEFVEFTLEEEQIENIKFEDNILNLEDYLDMVENYLPEGVSLRTNDGIMLKDPGQQGVSAQYLKITSDRSSFKVGYSSNQYKNYKDLADYNNLENNKTYELDVYYIFENDSGNIGDIPGINVPKDVTLTKTKQVVDNGDNTFDLSLSISGSIGSVKNKAKIDVLLLLDISNSMFQDSTRIASAKNAVSTLIDSLNDQGTVDAQYSVVTFKNSASTLVNWTKSGSFTKTKVNSLTGGNAQDGGTNYEAGFNKAIEQLKSARTQSQKVVIFLTDGAPTKSSTHGTGYSTTWDIINDSYKAAGEFSTNSVKPDRFYVIGMDMDETIDVANSKEDIEAKTLLETIFSYTSCEGDVKSPTAEQLGSIFGKIAEEVTYYPCSNVKISDSLSENVQPIVGQTGEVDFDILITDEEGQQLAENDDAYANINRVYYDEQTRAIKVEFAPNYQLEQGYTYRVSVKICPTDKAYENKETGYTDKADPDTGTYENQFGLYSNDNENAKVTYTYNQNDKTELFPKPVIQLKTEGGDNPEGGEVVEASPTVTKTAVKNPNDDSYKLTLSVSGSVGTVTNTKNVDVVIAFDTSNSMYDNPAYGTKRITYARNAVGTLVDSLNETENNNVDVRYSVVYFSTTSGVLQDWTDNIQSVKDSVNNADQDTYGGGTNYEAGLLEAQSQLNKARQGAETVVIFLTDGEPTFYNTDSGTDGLGSFTNERTLDHAKDAAGKLSASQFYLIGTDMNSDIDIYPNSAYIIPTILGSYIVGEPLRTITAEELLQEICDSAPSTMKRKEVYNTSSEKLSELFKDIAGNITYLECSNVTLTDPLSQYAEIVLDAEGKTNFTIQVFDENGNDVTSTEMAENVGDIRASYVEEKDEDGNIIARKIILDFKDDYTLKQGYVYQVSTDIKPTKTAYETYNTDQNYPDTPDEGTGTHADEKEKGFYSNDNENAKVIYTYKGKEASINFPKPVIQLQEGSLTIRKTISGLDDRDIDSLKGKLKFTYQLSGQQEQEIKIDNFEKNASGEYVGSITIDNLKAGSEYIVNEINQDMRLEGYTLSNDSDTAAKNVSILAGQNQEVLFKNVYEPFIGSITITKTDFDDNTLSGASFKIQQKVNGEWVDLQDAEIKTNAVGEDANKVTGQDGIFEIHNLRKGDYRIIETQSPNGHSLLANPIEITLPLEMMTEQIEDSEYDVENPTWCTDEMNYYYEVGFKVKNNSIFTMPEAGGRNIFMLTLAGTAMIALAAGSTIYYRRRRGAHNKTRR